MNGLRQMILAISFSMASLSALAQVPLLNNYPSARATVFLDFEGRLVQGTIWNRYGPIAAQAPGLAGPAITEIFKRIASNFELFNLNVTTDSNIYNKAPLLQRVRIIFTSTSSWYGTTGGASAIGSFTWGDETPGWVFCDRLGNNIKYIAAAASHEIGHTLGLQHQSLYGPSGNKISEYNGGQGSGETGWAPIMGIGYYKNHTGWLNGSSSENAASIQDDLAIIGGSPNNFGFRNDSSGEMDSPELHLTLTSTRQNERQYLSWHFSSPDSIDHSEIEFSKDGLHFQTLATVPANTFVYSLSPVETEDLSYRIKAIKGAETKSFYSNTLSLKGNSSEKKVRILDNPVRDLLTVISNGNYGFQLMNTEGRIISKGQLYSGINYLSVQFAPKGLLMLHWEDPTQQGAEKIIKQ